MDMSDLNNKRIRELIDRLSRIMAADEWSEDINPSQWTALSYLANANRFSRSPSQVAEYMSATRGTVSQTLKALARKGLIEEIRSKADKRSISYSVTKKGKELMEQRKEMEDANIVTDDIDSEILAENLETLARNTLRKRGQRPFGICGTCKYNQNSADGRHCQLLGEKLLPYQTNQICHEHVE